MPDPELAWASMCAFWSVVLYFLAHIASRNSGTMWPSSGFMVRLAFLAKSTVEILRGRLARSIEIPKSIFWPSEERPRPGLRTAGEVNATRPLQMVFRFIESIAFAGLTDLNGAV